MYSDKIINKLTFKKNAIGFSYLYYISIMKLIINPTNMMITAKILTTIFTVLGTYVHMMQRVISCMQRKNEN